MDTRSQPRRGLPNRMQPTQPTEREPIISMIERETDDETVEGYEARLLTLDRAAAEALMRLAGV
jgi:hypothetical protein